MMKNPWNKSKFYFKFKYLLLLQLCWWTDVAAKDFADYPEGYFSFEQNPTRRPPKVRKPPYKESHSVCLGILETEEESSTSLKNLCGNLNDGYLPVNPMGQNVYGESYPFQVIKNSTLDFFSKTLPILKEDRTLPKVAKYDPPAIPFRKNPKRRTRFRGGFNRFRRSLSDYLEREGLAKAPEGGTRRALLQEHFALSKAQQEGRSARSFCIGSSGMLCSIYNTFLGRGRQFLRQGVTERRDRVADDETKLENEVIRPLTPCPSTVEYVTPVFARNHQGVWRYVVQIPYEGYFTQTVETTQCLETRCHYLSGACLSSPRWVSLLVAEIYYPDVLFPSLPKEPNSIRAPVGKLSPPATRRGQFKNRQDRMRSDKETHHCDGRDNIGCFQVRLYYDWFLIPGACKCWKQNYLAHFGVN